MLWPEKKEGKQEYFSATRRDGTSLMVQWSGICLPVQGTWFDPWSRMSPHAMGQLNPCAATTQA